MARPYQTQDMGVGRFGAVTRRSGFTDSNGPKNLLTTWLARPSLGTGGSRAVRTSVSASDAMMA
jgi:hypothetical protein